MDHLAAGEQGAFRPPQLSFVLRRCQNNFSMNQRLTFGGNKSIVLATDDDTGNREHASVLSREDISEVI